MRDAAIVCVLFCACGGGDDREPPGSISVTVRASGAPVAGVPVWFSARDGATYETATSDVGVASAFVDDFTTVHVLTSYTLDSNPRTELRSFVDARIGDAIVIDEFDELAPPRHVTIVLPKGYASYAIATGCSFDELFGEPSSTTVFVAGCDAEVPFLIALRDAAGAPTAFIYRAPVALGDNVELDLTADPIVPAAQPIFDIAGVRHSSAVIFPYLIVGDSLLQIPQQAFKLAGGSASVAGTLPNLPDARFMIRTLLIEAATNQVDEIVEWGTLGSSIRFDATTVLANLPPPTLAQNALTWPEATGANMVFVQRVVSRQSPSSALLIAPISGTTISLPALPPALADFELRADESLEMSGQLIETSVGYDGLRAGFMNLRAHPLIAGESGRTKIRHFR